MDRQPVTGTAQIIRADSRSLPLADDSVDLVVTSPPYFGLRSYQDGGEHYEGQIGDEATPAEFLDALLEVTAECARVLKPSGSIWVNLGDKYAGGGMGGHSSADVPTKSLIGVPWRYALRCIDDLGLILRAEVIWSKPNGLPESVTDRVRRSHETWFHFVKSPRYFSAVDEIREEHSPESVRLQRQARERPRPADRHHEVGHYTPADTSGFGAGLRELSPLGKLPGSVWTIPTQPLRVPEHLGIDHFAAFPMEWPRRIIRGWSPSGVCVECGEGRRPVVDSSEKELHRPSGASRIGTAMDAAGPGAGVRSNVGNVRSVHRLLGYACACPEPTAATRPGVVLDPFGGTGTTALVAKALGRHGISVDMSADYCRLATWRTTDPAQLAKAARRPHEPSKTFGEAQTDLLTMLTEEPA
jgi:DNA modification methylase